jgi:hypothetical protein
VPGRFELGAPVDGNAGPARMIAPYADVDWPASRACDPEVLRSAVIADSRAGTTGENSGYEVALTREIGPADGVHARMDPVQSPLLDPVVDRLGRVPDLE